MNLFLPKCPNCGESIAPNLFSENGKIKCKKCGADLIEQSPRKYVVRLVSLMIAFIFPFILFGIFGKSWVFVAGSFIVAIAFYVFTSKYAQDPHV